MELFALVPHSWFEPGFDPPPAPHPALHRLNPPCLLGQSSGSNFFRNCPFSSSLLPVSQVRKLINVCDFRDAQKPYIHVLSSHWRPSSALLLSPTYRWENWGKVIMLLGQSHMVADGRAWVWCHNLDRQSDVSHVRALGFSRGGSVLGVSHAVL